MAYYILAKYIKDNSISNVNALVESFFDYVLLGIGNAPDVAEECNISMNLLTEIRNDFSYFYLSTLDILEEIWFQTICHFSFSTM